MRTCNCCGEKMEMGYCVHDSEYYCSDECLNSTYSPEEYNELCEEDSAYWTQWDENDIEE